MRKISILLISLLAFSATAFRLRAVDIRYKGEAARQNGLHLPA